MSDEQAFSSHLRIVLRGDDPTGQRAAGMGGQGLDAEVVLDATVELTAEREVEKHPIIPRPAEVGGPTDAVDPVLAALRRQLVDPVVAALLRADEVDEVVLRWGAEPRPDDVWVQLVARGEPFELLLHSPVDLAGPDHPAAAMDPASVAQNLAWNLVDFIAESRFGWGQQRIAIYQLPD